MTLPALYLTVLRVIHISAAFAWIGGSIFVVSILTPTVQAAGADGGRFMLHLARLGRMVRIQRSAALTTVLAGALLFWPTSGGLNGDWLKTLHGLCLTLGAITGILTLLHGLFEVGPVATKMGVVAQDILAHQGPPPPELMQAAQALGAKLGSSATVSLAMGAVALLLMASAQTL